MSGTPDIWGGIECSVVRVGDTVRNQLHDTGHLWRRDDIALIAGLGLKTVRYPVLWEMVEQQRGRMDWRWTDERLGELRKFGIAPIAGLVHHGSGPVWTNLLDPEFPEDLAAYAASVAARYPWLEMYTPVNEPFTTARLCGLYGLWHPHTRDEQVCFRITVAECRATALAMKAIRRINPHAKLVQTEDFGRIYSTPPLAEQAEYENERRWLSIDLLTGRVTESHPFYRRLIAAGVDGAHLEDLQAEPAVPDIIGIDYYLTSDRVLDHRLELHPDEPVGGNGRTTYVDIAAVRSDLPRHKTGLQGRLAEIWERYGLPIAVTELHNGCTRDEHVRWLMEGWRTAKAACENGIDVRAVTSWSLFGAQDWNSMLTRQDGYYECGAFDARYVPPQPTIVARAISHLAQAGEFDHPVLDRPGWWHRAETRQEDSRPIVLAGFERLASVIEECCSHRRLRVVPAGSVKEPAVLFERHDAWAVIRIEHRPPLVEKRSGAAALVLHCMFAEGGDLSLELPAQPDLKDFAHTFLDLMIDSRNGHLRCLEPPRSAIMNGIVGPAHQAGAGSYKADSAA